MPELPEVETIKEALKKSIGYSTINDVIINQNKLRAAIPDDFKEKVCGARIISYQRIAKYIVTNLSNGYSIVWHMGMSGRVKISDTMPPIEKHDHVIFVTDNGVIVYHDPRRFGLITYAKTDEIFDCPWLKNIGIDPVTRQLCAEYLYKKFQNKKIPVKIALLDQRIVAGIGNIYASEALFWAKVSPLRKTNEVSLEECARIVEGVQRVLKKAIEAGGSTLRDYHKPDGSEGYFQFQHCVYNKTGQRCPECHCDIHKTGGIQKVILGGRSSFYCPVLQK